MRVQVYTVIVVACGCSDVLAGCAERPPLCPEVYSEAEIPVPATNMTLDLMFDPISAQTTAGPAGTTVAITNNQGTVAFEGRGPFPAFIFSKISAPPGQPTLYSGLGIEDGTWFPFWLYCTDDGRLTWIDGEMTDRDLGVTVQVEGTCSTMMGSRTITVEVPAHSLRSIALTCGFDVVSTSGSPLINLQSSRAGSIDFGQGDSVTVLPFHTVDCRTDCGSPGWYELHAVVWDSVEQTVGFNVFYLAGSGVSESDGLVLPTLAQDIETFPNATWTLER